MEIARNCTLGKILRKTSNTKTSICFDKTYFGIYNAKHLDIRSIAGSSTTGIAANLANRRFLGIDKEEDFLTISKNRKIEIENPKTSATYKQKIGGFNNKKELELFLVKEPRTKYKTELNLENKRGNRLIE